MPRTAASSTSGMAVQDVLDLARVHVAPVADYEVLRAADDPERAVRVDAGEVARPQPAVRREHGARLVGPVPVALHHVGPADDDLADAARRDVAQAHLDAIDGRPDRPRAARVRRAVERRHRRGLGEPVALEQARRRAPARTRRAARAPAARRRRCTCAARACAAARRRRAAARTSTARRRAR